MKSCSRYLLAVALLFFAVVGLASDVSAQSESAEPANVASQDAGELSFDSLLNDDVQKDSLGLIQELEEPVGLESQERKGKFDLENNRPEDDALDSEPEEEDEAIEDEAAGEHSLDGNGRSDFSSLSVMPINQIALSIQPSISAPTDRHLPTQGVTALPKSIKLYQWEADNVAYRNLIFEEPALERHGHCLPGQSIRSGIKFVGRAAVYPADLLKRHNRRCDNPLGWGQPGTCPR